MGKCSYWRHLSVELYFNKKLKRKNRTNLKARKVCMPRHSWELLSLHASRITTELFKLNAKAALRNVWAILLVVCRPLPPIHLTFITSLSSSYTPNWMLCGSASIEWCRIQKKKGHTEIATDCHAQLLVVTIRVICLVGFSVEVVLPCLVQ